MAVPKMAQLRFGMTVNVVLKADQRSGKFTTGQISDFLTRGDHPRGIKVRLSTGQIGRVQSIHSSSEQPVTIRLTSLAQTSLDGQNENSPDHFGRRRKGTFASQGDYRQEPIPMIKRSLADYVRVPISSKDVSSSGGMAGEDAIQKQLEKEFPNLDSALIAAILADYEDVKDARDVLSSLS